MSQINVEQLAQQASSAMQAALATPAAAQAAQQAPAPKPDQPPQYFGADGMPMCEPSQITYGPPDSEGIRHAICGVRGPLYNQAGEFVGHYGDYIPTPLFPVFDTPFGPIAHPSGAIIVDQAEAELLSAYLNTVLNPGWLGRPGYLASIPSIYAAWEQLGDFGRFSAVNILTDYTKDHPSFHQWWWMKPGAGAKAKAAAPVRVG